mgnify:CR=1 FL=1
MSTPILNAPQSAILGLHKIEDRAVVVQKGANKEVVIRSMMYLALSYDHRMIDGKEATGGKEGMMFEVATGTLGFTVDGKLDTQVVSKKAFNFAGGALPDAVTRRRRHARVLAHEGRAGVQPAASAPVSAPMCPPG